MSRIYLCPHCHAQNFATRARLRKAPSVPLKCWKCGKGIKETSASSNRREKGRTVGRGPDR